MIHPLNLLVLVVLVLLIMGMAPVFYLPSLDECMEMDGYDADLNEYTGPAGECWDMVAAGQQSAFIAQVCMAIGLGTFTYVYTVYLYKPDGRNDTGHGRRSAI